jgi:hypothetical protein
LRNLQQDNFQAQKKLLDEIAAQKKKMEQKETKFDKKRQELLREIDLCKEQKDLMVGLRNKRQLPPKHQAQQANTAGKETKLSFQNQMKLNKVFSHKLLKAQKLSGVGG